ncbi:transglutaminase [Acuticoccus sediminis]|uniref:Transglutaminase n=1 Tax=Acuticoccus sediminis TaxID=2184697 RepID=A0A8B2NNE9_9HYPH|nr:MULTISPECIES: transglutaminase family protein [Acuticoccus]MCF3934360.1 transglutaminase family protein [Acuticoccus kalidii]RAH95929.1 transglutaminase [Acuticoccus sediminis]
MFIRAGFEITITCDAPTPLLLALSPHSTYPNRIVGNAGVRTTPSVPTTAFVDGFGNWRTRLVAPVGELTLSSDILVEDSGAPDRFNWDARQHEVADLPSDTLTFLTASRYCEVDELVARAWELFGSVPPGWARVQAISNFVHNHLTFGYGFGRSTKTAVDAMREKTGVCRDFAQLSLALCRAMNIPARYASGYLGDVGVPDSGPADFCAWIEVFLEGEWYTFDARYNTPRIGRILLVRGQDAADVPMITAFGSYRMSLFRVWCDEVSGTTSEADRLAMLQSLPDSQPLTLAAE